MQPASSPALVSITSRSSQWFKRFRKAIDEHEHEVVLEGPKQIRDSIALGWRPLAIAWDGDQAGPLAAAAPRLGFEKSLFHALSTTRHSQGVLGLFERRHYKLEDVFADESRIAVILDAVQDPGNVGTMIRLAAAFEASGVVVVSGSADPLSQKAIRASAGAVLQIPVARARTDEILSALQERSWPLFAASRLKGTDVDDNVPSSRAAIVFGNEGAGVSPDFLKMARPLSVKISESVESLNVAAAAAILLSKSYELRITRP